MRYWILIEIPHTGEPNRRQESLDLVDDALVHLDDELGTAREHVSTGFSSDSRSTEVSFTMEPDVAGPLMAMSLAFGALRVALVDSDQETHWDLNNAVVRVAPSAKAAKIYRGRDSMALPHNYTGPMPDSDAMMPGYPDKEPG